MRKIRNLGQILLDMEFLLDEMVDNHELQMGDILALIHIHLRIHRPDCIETFEDETNPEFKYE